MKKSCIYFLVPPSVEEKIPDRVFGCNYAIFFQHNIFMLGSAAMLSQNGCNVKVTDCVVEKKSLDEILKEEADIYVFYSVFLSRRSDLTAASYIENLKGKNTPIIFMGTDPTYYPGKYLLSPNRFVVRGEPEYTLLDLVSNITGDITGIEGVSWIKNGSIVHNHVRDYIRNLDALPAPDRTMLSSPFSFYNAKFKKLPSTTMSTSRGCSFNCYYCVPNSLCFARELEWKRWYGKKPAVVLRSSENVITEFQAISKLGYRSVFIVDDQFIWGKKRTVRILDALRELDFEISLLARPDMIQDEELARKMKDAGVSHVDIGVESFCQEILDYIRKDLDVHTINRAVRLLKNFDIEPEINIMFGSCPLETKETIRDTIEKVEKLNVEIVHISICTPFPGTDFHKQAKKEGWMLAEDYHPVDPALDSLIAYPHLSKQDLVKAVKNFYFRHYFSWKYLFRQLIKVNSIDELCHKLRTARNIWKKVLWRR